MPAPYTTSPTNSQIMSRLTALHEDNLLEPMHYETLRVVCRDAEGRPSQAKLEAMHGIARTLEHDLQKLKEGKL